MNIYNKIFIVIAIVLIVVILWFLATTEPIQALTDRSDYSLGGALEVTIKNNQGKAICFSSCLPYFVERFGQDKKWNSYDYGSCQDEDKVVGCVSPQGVKKFRLSLSDVGSGLHRLKIQLCVDCAVGQNFKTDSTLYSNDFKIN